jgi:hypothetical protein
MREIDILTQDASCGPTGPKSLPSLWKSLLPADLTQWFTDAYTARQHAAAVAPGGYKCETASKCEPTGPMDSDADISGGNSAGPLWINENGDRYQYAICSASGRGTSIHSGGSNWLNTIVSTGRNYA